MQDVRWFKYNLNNKLRFIKFNGRNFNISYQQSVLLHFTRFTNNNK